ncbi:AAEL000192-PA [Aedes aegypti]|uniref:AAEL000192-PA n=1 Tax=Aedes aegypti TaxID=7159 RepID=Q17PX6_AEDAE|nr:AAEL000192-PA [Aedes aegypti]
MLCDLNECDWGHKYCIAFLIMKVTKQCHKDPNYKTLLEGDRIVVHCDLRPSSSPNGTSTEQDPHENSIPDESNEENDDDDDDDENGNTNIDDYDRSFQKHPRSRKAPQRTIPDRCLGEGFTGRNTRFASLVTPTCHGKWLRLTGVVPKKCSSSEAQFIFV